MSAIAGAEAYPQIAIPRHPHWVSAYDGAWRFASATPPAGLGPLAATALRVYGRYARPAIASDTSNASLAAWTEWQHYSVTVDKARLARILPYLAERFNTFKAERRLSSGLYRGTLVLEAQQNSPRPPGGWVDVTARQALEAESLAASGDALGQTVLADTYRTQWRDLCADLNRNCWDDALGFYCDCDESGGRLPLKTSAGFWPLAAGAATPAQAARLAAHLSDSQSFWRVHPVPSLAADHPRYADRGALWRGSVWPLENYAIVQGLERYGYHDLAVRLADNHITTLSHVYKETLSHWDNYAPDYIEPGSIAQPDSAAAGVSAVALLLETILGFRVDAPAQTLHWRPALFETYSVLGLPVGDVLVDVQVTAVKDGDCMATVWSSGPLRMHLVNAPAEEWTTLCAQERIMKFNQISRQ